MVTRSYKLSPEFIALAVGACTLGLVFFALPYAALMTIEAPAEFPPFTVSVDPANKVILPDQGGSIAALGPRILAAALYGIGDATESAAAAIMATRVYDAAMPASAPTSFSILPGMRAEQVADTLAHPLRWSHAQKQIFLDMATAAGDEGRLYPSTYVVAASTTPAEAYGAIKARFEARVLSRYTPEVAEAVPVADALALASIIEREAGTVDEMRTIAGILWNRLFIGMRLQADPTLQYARGTAKNGWWPVPRSRDKYIASPYNTYLHEGLPPTPIASPSAAAIAAALNPRQTECLFFFHARGDFYCSATYDEHVKKLKTIYGRGR